MATYYERDYVGEWEVTRNPTGMVARDLDRRGRLLRQYARAQVGKKTGRLMRKITSQVKLDARGLYALVGSNDPISLLHHEGSKPHEIRPRRARALKFVHRGRIRYAHRVYHPGTKPNRYLTDNLRRVVD